MKISSIAFTQAGLSLGRKLQRLLPEESVSLACGTGNHKVSLKNWTAEMFPVSDALVFIGATGIAVRAIAPHLKSKSTDPAVVVIDDRAKFCISLASGHLGGANDLTRRLAALLNAVPVVTTATDNHGVFAVDSWAKSQGFVIANPEEIKTISSKLLAGDTVRLSSDFPIAGKIPEGLLLVPGKPFDIHVTLRPRNARGVLYLIPPIAAVGVGCRRDIAQEALEQAYDLLLSKGSVDSRAVTGAFTIDMKHSEPGLLAFCQKRDLPLTCYTAAQLNAVKGSFTASAFVQKTTGTDNVCERSAVLGCGGGRLYLKKNAGNGVTMAMALRDLTVRFEEDV